MPPNWWQVWQQVGYGIEAGRVHPGVAQDRGDGDAAFAATCGTSEEHAKAAILGKGVGDT